MLFEVSYGSYQPFNFLLCELYTCTVKYSGRILVQAVVKKCGTDCRENIVVEFSLLNKYACQVPRRKGKGL